MALGTAGRQGEEGGDRSQRALYARRTIGNLFRRKTFSGGIETHKRFSCFVENGLEREILRH